MTGKRDKDIRNNSATSPDKSIIIGRNPVLEALASGRLIEKLLIGKGAEGSAKKIIGIAKDRKLPITFADKIILDRAAGVGTHQGVVAYVSAYEYGEMEDLFESAKSRGEDPFFVILDGLEDPHNLGAVLRTADAAGAHGVIIPKRRAVGLTETVAKASAGAIEYVPVVKVTNIAQTIDELKERGVWIAACDMGDNIHYNADLKGPIAIVIGSEGFGIGKLIGEKCDFTVSIPMKGKINSLNASNAAAVMLYEVRRQRDTG
ncbi:MAG: 23S rRNA (guanosine(2251)-2'-O)-methyltransferase RlmB [Eubacteriales bacterium]|nr:23S rRNA (guanosine(2251)-2'-O)-methyltransferase RlmB [Eubacteriales bacterium]MDD4389605.1 23S rRNA (guanosine(2251)-2'-O)-methyltransferase RlmB [Eubacteriales bacterium]